MKTLPLLTRLFFAALTAAIFITGCKKDQPTDRFSTQEEEQANLFATQLETDAQFSFDDITDIVIGINSEVGIGGVGIFGRLAKIAGVDKTDSLPSCVTFTISPLQPGIFPKTLTLDFGSGCLIQGHLRAGKMTTVYSGRLTDPGKTATTTFENFNIDSIKVDGTHKLTNTTTAGSNQRQLKVEVINGKLTRNNGSVEDWNASRNYTQMEGNGTLTPLDDVLRITGSSQGKLTRPNFSVSWTSEVTEPLIRRFTCRWVSKGIINTQRSGQAAGSLMLGSLDFGGGTCDNKANLDINGNVHQIVLK